MDLGYKLFKTLDFLFGIPSKIKERNNLIEYKQKKAIIDKLKEKYGLTGSNDKDGDTFCTIELDLYNKKWVVISCKNKTYNIISNYDNFWYIPDFKWKWPEPIDNWERGSFYIRQKNCQNDYYLTFGNPVPIKEDATFEEVEAILLRLMKRFKELQVEYKEKKAADDF